MHLGGSALLIAAYTSTIVPVAVSRRRLWAAFLFATVLLASGEPRDALHLGLPLLAALAAMHSPRTWWTDLGAFLGALASAAAGLSKFSVVPLALMAFLIADLVRLSRREWPFLTPAFVLSSLLLFVLTAGSEVWPFLIGNLNIVSGYSAAMSIPGPGDEIALFLLSSSALMALVASCELWAARTRLIAFPEAVGRTALFAAFLFVLWKAGFVRHDMHSLIAGSGFTLAAVTYAVALPRGRSVRQSFLPAASAALGVALLIFPLGWSMQKGSTLIDLFPRIVGEVRLRWSEARDWIRWPSETVSSLQRSKDEAWAAVRRSQPLPDLRGSVDIIPSKQSSLIAHGLSYRPRFTIQEFAAYTEHLMRGNRRSLIEHGPDYLIFEPGSIDERHPASAEGALWPDIVRLYEAVSFSEPSLVLKKRTNPADVEPFGPTLRHRVRFGEDLALAAGDTPQFLAVAIRPSLVGRLVGFLFRPPIARLSVTYADGASESYRLVPANAEAGFVVSPLVRNAEDFALMVHGHTSQLPRATRISVETSRIGRWMYRSTVAVAVRPLRMDRSGGSLPPAPIREAISRGFLRSLLASVGPSDNLHPAPEGLFAHLHPGPGQAGPGPDAAGGPWAGPGSTAAARKPVQGHAQGSRRTRAPRPASLVSIAS